MLTITARRRASRSRQRTTGIRRRRPRLRCCRERTCHVRGVCSPRRSPARLGELQARPDRGRTVRMTTPRAVARHVARPAARTRPRLTRCHRDELTAASGSPTCRTTRWRARGNARPRPRRRRIRHRGTPKSASCLDNSFGTLRVPTSLFRRSWIITQVENDVRERVPTKWTHFSNISRSVVDACGTAARLARTRSTWTCTAT